MLRLNRLGRQMFCPDAACRQMGGTDRPLANVNIAYAALRQVRTQYRSGSQVPAFDGLGCDQRTRNRLLRQCFGSDRALRQRRSRDASRFQMIGVYRLFAQLPLADGFIRERLGGYGAARERVRIDGPVCQFGSRYAAVSELCCRNSRIGKLVGQYRILRQLIRGDDLIAQVIRRYRPNSQMPLAYSAGGYRFVCDRFRLQGVRPYRRGCQMHCIDRSFRHMAAFYRLLRQRTGRHRPGAVMERPE